MEVTPVTGSEPDLAPRVFASTGPASLAQSSATPRLWVTVTAGTAVNLLLSLLFEKTAQGSEDDVVVRVTLNPLR